jgi:alpha-L-fucosidase
LIVTTPTRRDFFQTSLGAAAVAALPQALARPAEPNKARPYRTDKPLLQLQQEFVDLRFGMFLHFNLATFQDREWGDPKDPPGVFNPSN